MIVIQDHLRVGEWRAGQCRRHPRGEEITAIPDLPHRNEAEDIVEE
jgi:hypothetical protein